MTYLRNYLNIKDLNKSSVENNLDSIFNAIISEMEMEEFFNRRNAIRFIKI